MKAILVKILLKVGSELLINFLKSGAEELQKRNDNDFQQADNIKQTLESINVRKK